MSTNPSNSNGVPPANVPVNNNQTQPPPPPPLPPVVILSTATGAQAQAQANPGFNTQVAMAVIFLGAIVHPSVGLLGAGVFVVGHAFNGQTIIVRGWTGGLLDRLNNLPIMRDLHLNATPARAISSFDLNNRRWSYRASAAGQLVGTARPFTTNCSQCRSRHGTFSECVVVPGFFGGACCNCMYGGHPERCSLYTGFEGDDGNGGGGAKRGGKGNRKGGGRNGGGANRGVARGRGIRT